MAIRPLYTCTDDTFLSIRRCLHYSIKAVCFFGKKLRITVVRRDVTMMNVRRPMLRRRGRKRRMRRVLELPGGGVEIPAGRKQTIVLPGPHTRDWHDVPHLDGGVTSICAKVDMEKSSVDTESEVNVSAGLIRLTDADRLLVPLIRPPNKPPSDPPTWRKFSKKSC